MAYASSYTEMRFTAECRLRDFASWPALAAGRVHATYLLSVLNLISMDFALVLLEIDNTLQSWPKKFLLGCVNSPPGQRQVHAT